jgi:hypothetical protein
MRFLKRLIIAVLVYIAVYLPFVAILQAVSGGEYTAAYSVGGIVGAIELALSSIIKITENREVKKNGYIESNSVGDSCAGCDRSCSDLCGDADSGVSGEAEGGTQLDLDVTRGRS